VILVLDAAMIGFNPQFFGDLTMTILNQNLVPIIPSLTFADPHIEVVRGRTLNARTASVSVRIANFLDADIPAPVRPDGKGRCGSNADRWKKS
jgi:hypothetical protein